MSPFYLLYGRELSLTIDKIKEPSLQQLRDRLYSLIQELPMKQAQAQDNVAQQQNKQKARHDQHIKTNQIFAIGDKVLYFRAEKEKYWSEKLDEKWKGPYYVHIVG